MILRPWRTVKKVEVSRANTTSDGHFSMADVEHRMALCFPAAKDSAVIKNIILRGVSSYSSDKNSTIGPLTKVNVFYGQNGTGKTTIGNYLQDPGDVLYYRCSALPMDAEREVLVYNHTFTESNFHASSQPGVFTLNEGNIEAEKNLGAAELALKKLMEDHQAGVVFR